jgi:hypothetical protein
MKPKIQNIQKFLLSCLFQLYGQIWPNPPTNDQLVEVGLHSSPQNWKKKRKNKRKKKVNYKSEPKKKLRY